MADWVIGGDEAGRGPYAGPVAVVAILGPKGWTLPGINDSKKLTPKKREALHAQIIADPWLKIFREWRTNDEIDTRGLHRCCLQAFSAAIKAALIFESDAEVIIDGNMYFTGFKYKSIPKADALFPLVSAASIVAKVERDKYMCEVAHPQYPQYEWNVNMGYGVPGHIAALKIHGPSPLHRKSFRPIAELLREEHEKTKCE